MCDATVTSATRRRMLRAVTWLHGTRGRVTKFRGVERFRDVVKSRHDKFQRASCTTWLRRAQLTFITVPRRYLSTTECTRRKVSKANAEEAHARRRDVFSFREICSKTRRIHTLTRIPLGGLGDFAKFHKAMNLITHDLPRRCNNRGEYDRR